MFDPAQDFSGYRDVPCTLGYRFALREGALHMFTSMRSQDAWLGLPYDVFTFTILHELLAGWLNADLGEYHHLVDSLHLYEQHVDAVADLRQWPHRQPSMAPLAVPWTDFDAMLAQVIAGEPVGHHGWDDFAVVLVSYRQWKQRDHDAAQALIETSSGPLATALRRWYLLLQNNPEAVAAAPTTPLGRSEVVA